MSLVEPEKKMSKSDPESTINIFDEPDMIKKKLAKAVTATDAPKGTVPKGVQNLFDLLELFGNPKLLQKFQKEYNDNTFNYSDLKTTLEDTFSENFSPFRATKPKFHKNQKQA